MQNIQKDKYSTQLEVSGRLSAVDRGGPRAETGDCNIEMEVHAVDRAADGGLEVKSREVRKGDDSAGRCVRCEDPSLDLSTQIKKTKQTKPKCDRTPVI